MSAPLRARLLAAAVLATLLACSWFPAARAQAEADQSAAAHATAPPIEPSARPGETAAPAQPQAWLRGPFGRVLGGSVEDAATTAPSGQPLDAFVRRAPLSMDWEVDALIVSLEVVAQPLADGPSDEVLSTGAPVFEGPATVGDSLVVATLTSATGQTSQYAWLLEVPDREPPDDGLYDIPAPDVIIESGAGSVAGVLGDGCYVFLCVDAGRMPPPRMLDPLAVVLGELLSMHLGDESALTAWEGSLTRLGQASGEVHTASGGPLAPGQAVVELTGLEVPAAGHWLLELEVELDRERGWLRTVYRLVAE